MPIDHYTTLSNKHFKPQRFSTRLCSGMVHVRPILRKLFNCQCIGPETEHLEPNGGDI